MKLPKKLRTFLNDSVWSIAGLVLMNVVAQFIVYPAWNRRLGNEVYGDVLYLISMMNILVISAGTACNSVRMVRSTAGTTQNGDYSMILLVITALAVPVCTVLYLQNQPGASVMEITLFSVLAVLTLWRFYADVRYRLRLDYHGYFLYYLVISLGYGLGIILFWVTGHWALALIPGELAGICMAYFRDDLLRRDFLRLSGSWKTTVRMSAALLGAYMISNIIFNGDRMILNLLMGGTAVTVYYLASLLGKTMSLITTPLNSVIIGYLARYKHDLTVQLMNALAGLVLAASVVGTAGCTLASYILIPILYPQNFEMVKPFFLIANLTQILYFASNVVVTVLLRFSKVGYQITVNSIYAAAFLALCIPASLGGRMDVFCVALLITNFIRLSFSLLLGYREALRKKGENHDD